MIFFIPDLARETDTSLLFPFKDIANRGTSRITGGLNLHPEARVSPNSDKIKQTKEVNRTMPSEVFSFNKVAKFNEFKFTLVFPTIAFSM